MAKNVYENKFTFQTIINKIFDPDRNTISVATESGVSTATLSNVASSNTTTTLLSANSARRSATFVNDSTSVCYVKFGTTASATSFTVKMQPGDYYELPQPCYTGRIDAIWVSANGNMRITELTD